jgi:hypothetical protein
MIQEDQVEATAEGEFASRGEALRRVQVDHPPSVIIGDINERTTRSRSRNASHFAHSAFVATFEPKDIGHALSDPNWVNAMHEELENFEKNHVLELVEPPPNCKPIGTKWVWKNKEGENGEVVRNKSRLVAQSYSLKEGVDGVYSYQTSYVFASGQIPCYSQGTLLPSSGEPKVSNLWNNVQRNDLI